MRAIQSVLASLPIFEIAFLLEVQCGNGSLTSSD